MYRHQRQRGPVMHRGPRSAAVASPATLPNLETQHHERHDNPGRLRPRQRPLPRHAQARRGRHGAGLPRPRPQRRRGRRRQVCQADGARRRSGVRPPFPSRNQLDGPAGAPARREGQRCRRPSGPAVLRDGVPPRRQPRRSPRQQGRRHAPAGPAGKPGRLAADRGGGDSISSTARASSTATSSRPTSCSTRTATLSSAISASPRPSPARPPSAGKRW